MLAGRKKGAGVAQVDAFAVGIVFYAEMFIGIVADGREHFETDDVFVAEGVGVASGKIPIDAVAHLVAGAVYGNGFGDEERSVLLEGDFAVKVEDAFGLRLAEKAENTHASSPERARKVRVGK